MDVRDAVASRYSCRAFRPDPVPLNIVRDILDRAARAPSGGNVQPWLVHALAGERLEALKNQLRPRFANELPYGEGAEYEVYPRDLKEPYYTRRSRVGSQLYASIGIPREDRPARYRQFARNYLLYDAPVGLFVSLDRQMVAAAMVGCRWVHPDHYAAGARPRPAHLRTGSLDQLAQDRVALPWNSPRAHPVLRHRARICR
jgi:nitroreductase